MAKFQLAGGSVDNDGTKITVYRRVGKSWYRSWMLQDVIRLARKGMCPALLREGVDIVVEIERA